MTKYSLTKSPDADNIVSHSKGGDGITAIEVTKNPGYETVSFQKNAETQASIVKSGGGSLAAFYAPLTSSLSAGASTPTFTRAYEGYVEDSAGTLVVCAVDEYRLKGSTRNGADDWTAHANSEGLLVEVARTNICTQNRNLTHADWDAQGAPTVAQDAIGLDGGTTAWTLTDGDGSFNYIGNTVTIVADTDQWTGSVYIKKDSDETRFAGVFVRALSGGTDTYDYLHINTKTGAGALAGGAGAGFDHWSITSDGDWWFVQATLTNTSNTTMNITIMPALGTVIGTNNAAATGSAIFDRPQLEKGAFATSRIDTTTAAVERAVDLAKWAYVPPTNDMTIACTWTPLEDSGDTHWIWASYSDASNYLALLYDGTNVTFRKRIAGANNDAVKATNIVDGTSYRVVGRLDSSAGVDVWVATVKGTTDVTTTAAVVGSNMEIGSDGNSLNQSAMTVKEVKIFETAKTDAECAAL